MLMGLLLGLESLIIATIYKVARFSFFHSVKFISIRNRMRNIHACTIIPKTLAVLLPFNMFEWTRELKMYARGWDSSKKRTAAYNVHLHLVSNNGYSLASSYSCCTGGDWGATSWTWLTWGGWGGRVSMNIIMYTIHSANKNSSISSTTPTHYSAD